MTDEAVQYAQLGKEFAAHDLVEHTRGEYGYTDRKTGAKINTNTVEGYYRIFKRGMKGVYQHCAEKHLHRYLAEFDFRYSNRTKPASTILPAPTRRLRASSGSASPIKRLTRGGTDMAPRAKPNAKATRKTRRQGAI